MTNEQEIAMISHIKEYIVDNQGDKEYGGALDMAIEALERTRWIPVSERLPEKEDGDKYGTVLWCILYKEQHQLICDGHYQWKSKDGSQTHWMPLPEPPEQEV